MLFNSTIFLVFLPIVFAVYWLQTPWKKKWQNAMLLISSYFFYGWWDWRFLVLLVFSTGLDFLAGMMIDRENEDKRRKILLWATVTLNVAILGFFKYYNFFADSAANLLTLIGLQANPWSLNIILPVGISFYTFHGLSYVIDIYFRRIRHIDDPVDYSVFVCYFPLLVAGPIERATNLLPQLQRQRHFSYEQAIDGFRTILWGFFKKLVIADTIANEVDVIFDGYSGLSGGTLLLGAVCFAIQVYADFSGYSDIASGVSNLFGIKVLENFRTPYLSRSIPEFWSRWHISLSTWLNDYVFTPLAIEFRHMGRHGLMTAVMVTFLVSGLWHGAAWHFVAWGALHGLFYIPYVYRKKGLKSLTARKQPSLTLMDIPSIALTFGLVCIGYVLFRSEDMVKASKYLGRILKNPFSMDVGYPVMWPFILIFATLLIDWLFARRFFTGRYKTGYLLAETLFLVSVLVTMGNFGSKKFIYFVF